ncbi:hypothetical protein GCM10027417_07700 [Glutamicibacter endophyticus]
MTLNNSEFDNVRQDEDIDEPLDGRDSQPMPGSPDATAELYSEDPLRGVDQVLEENDLDPLQLNPENLPSESATGEAQAPESDSDAEANHRANLPDQRDNPDHE